MNFARCALLVFVVSLGLTGCASVDSPSESYQKWSDYFECKARKKRLKEAERRAAKEERKRAEAECSCQPPREKGQLKDKTQTEVRFLLENDISMVDYSLDFQEIQRMAKQQAKLDEEYEKARKAWEEFEAERRRRHDLQEQARAREAAEAPAMCNPESCGCVRVTPSCAYPPPKDYAKSPPPKRRAVGLEEIPIVIRAHAKFDVGQFALQRARVKQDYQPGKQPCCPRCGVSGCGESCDACGYAPPVSRSPDVPPAPPAGAESDDYPSARNSPEENPAFLTSAGLFSLGDGE